MPGTRKEGHGLSRKRELASMLPMGIVLEPTVVLAVITWKSETILVEGGGFLVPRVRQMRTRGCL